MSKSCKTTSVRVSVSILGYGYLVLFKDRCGRLIGSGHYVGKDKRCLTCNSGLCPAIAAVARYLKAGGQRAPDPPPHPQAAALPAAQDQRQTEEAPHRFWSMPQTCPICGAPTERDRALDSEWHGPGWLCTAHRYLHLYEARYGHLKEWFTRNTPKGQQLPLLPEPKPYIVIPARDEQAAVVLLEALGPQAPAPGPLAQRQRGLRAA